MAYNLICFDNRKLNIRIYYIITTVTKCSHLKLNNVSTIKVFTNNKHLNHVGN